MKKCILYFGCLLSILVVFQSCQQAETIAPVASQIAPTDCGETGTVLKNECGWYVQMDDGATVFATSFRGVILSEGMTVSAKYSVQTASSNHNSTCGDGCSSCSSSAGVSESSLTYCMNNDGIQQVVFSCVAAVAVAVD